MASCRILGRVFQEARFSVINNHASKMSTCVDKSVCKGRNLSIKLNSRAMVRSFASSSLDSDFKDASRRINTLKEEPDNDTKLQLYALFKQASSGPCNTAKPGMMDFVGQAKWKSWKALGDISQEEAKKQYIGLVTKLAGSAPAPAAQAAPAAGSEQKYANFEVISRDRMDIIRFNRPEKKNAFSLQMYVDFVKILSEVGQNDNAITVVTGTGDYFSSGNDLKNLMNADPKKIHEAVSHAIQLVQNLVAAYIDFPKPLVTVVNGHAVGIMVTLLALCDGVYATEKATFHTPFSQLGQNAEACSTYTFPRMMGNGLAADMLLFGNKIDATEAYRRGLVTKVFPDNLFERDVWPELKKFAALPKGSMRDSKRITRDIDRAVLHKANETELKLLKQRTQTEECMTAVINFMNRKSS